MSRLNNEKYIAHGTSVPKKTILTVLCLLTLEATVVAHGSAVAAPQNVRFNSYNLRNILEWRPGSGAGNRTRYTVQYAIYGDGEENKERVIWRTKRHCKDVLQTTCDLSHETSDLEEEYYGRVKAVTTAGASKWMTSNRFNPKRQTTFGPPIAKVTISERKLTIKLKGPMRWKIGNSSKEQSLAKYYPQMMYNISIRNSRTKKMMIFLLHNNSMEYGLLNYSTEFCVSAKVLFLSSISQTRDSPSQCVTTAKDPFFEQMLLVLLGCILPVALTVFFLTLIGCLVYHYIFGNKQKKPSSLWVQHQPDTEVLLTINLINISLPKPNPVEELKEASTPPEPTSPAPKDSDQQKDLAPRILGYATQTCAPPLLPQLPPVSDGREAHVWPSGSPAWGSLSQSSDYGLVGKASSLKEEEEEDVGGPEGCGQQLAQQDSSQWRQFQAVQTSGHEEEDEAEEADMDGSILVDWDPSTGKLQIPNLSLLQMEPDQVEEERPECDRVEPTDILSNVYIRQSSESSTESEDALTKIENNWDLQIDMEKS